MKQMKSKPWYRMRNIFFVIFSVLPLVIAWVFFQVLFTYTAKPNPTIDYRAKLRTIAEEQLNVDSRQASDAWSQFITTLDLFQTVNLEINDELIASEFTSRIDGDDGMIDYFYVRLGASLPKNIERELAGIELVQSRGVMDALDEYIKIAPGVRQLYGEGSLFNLPVPDLSQTRQLSSLLATKMRLASVAGKVSQCPAILEKILVIAHTIGHQPSLIDYLVGQAIWDMALGEIRYELSELRIDETTCEKLLELLDKFNLPPASYAIKGEQLLLEDLIQWSFSDNGYLLVRGPGGSAVIGENDSILGALQNRFYCADQNTTEQMLDECMQTMINLSHKLPIDRFPSVELDRFNELLQLNSQRMVLTSFVPALDSFINRSSIVQLQIQGTRLMLAIELYQARHSELPKTLDDLVPNIIADLPTDPITGGSYLYRLLENDPENRKYLLYSTGLDQQDNGGDFNIEGSINAVIHPPARTDYLINQLRPSIDEYY